MTPVAVSERAFEDAIECAFLRWGPDACPRTNGIVHDSSAPHAATVSPPAATTTTPPSPPPTVIDFHVNTQPRTRNHLKQHHDADVRKHFLNRAAS